MKRKIFVIMTFVLTLCCGLFLTACSGDENISHTEPTPISIQLEYNGNVSDFNVNGWSNIAYSENTSFEASDFKVFLMYTDGNIKEVTSNFSFNVYVQVNNDSYDETTTFEPGNTYKIVVECDGISREVYFDVDAITISQDDNNFSTTLETSYPYIPNGKVSPDFTLTYNDKQLVEGEDYRLEYGENNYVGDNAGSVTVIFAGIYAGEITLYFDITPIQIGEVVLSDITTIYNGQDKKVECQIDLSDNPIEGVQSINYDYYDSNQDLTYDVKNVGQYQVVAHIIPSEGYKQVQDIAFNLIIQQLDISNFDLSEYDFDSNHKFNDVTMKFINDDYVVDYFYSQVYNAMPNIDFELAMSSGNDIDNKNVSTTQRCGQFEIVGVDNCKGTLYVPFTIEPADIKDSGITNTANFVYDGTAKLFEGFNYLFSSGNNVDLVEGVDYTIQYKDNINAGEASYTLTGIGNYTGIKQGTFTISKKEINPGFCYDWNADDVDFTYNGEVQDFASVLVEKEGIGYTSSELSHIFNILYKAYTYNGQNQTWEETEFLNANTYRFSATFTLKDNNYKLPMELDENYNYVDATDYKYESYSTVAIKKGIVDFSYAGETTFEYTGDTILPDYDLITITFNGKSLLQGTDYSITPPTESVNANENYNLTISLTSNYGFFENNTDVTSSKYLNYIITRKVLVESDLNITWPTVYKNVWTYSCYLSDNSQGSIKLNEKNTVLDSEFFYTEYIKYPNTNISGRSVVARINDSNYVVMTDKTENATECDIYKFIGKNSYVDDILNYEITNNYFETFIVNGSQLSPQQIEDLLASGLNYGQEITIACNDGYKFMYGFQADSSGRYPYDDYLQTLTFRVGEGSYYNESTQSQVTCDLTSMHSIFMNIIDTNNDNKLVTSVSDISIYRIRITSTLDKVYDGEQIEELTYESYLPTSAYHNIVVSYYKIVNNNRIYMEGAIPTDAGVYIVNITAQNEDTSYVYGFDTKFTISRAEAKEGVGENDYAVPTNLTAVEGETLEDVSLPANFTWEDDETTSVGTVGKNTFLATFVSPNGNYQKNGIEITITVSEA